MKPIDWTTVRKVLVVKLRSIGDTVLATPSLTALRRFLPTARIDILLEDWVAPLLEDFDSVDNVITVGQGISSRLSTMRLLRAEGYDVAFNLHGGTTSTFFTRASGARHRIGYAEYQYSFLYNYLYSSSADFWGREKTHSAEQQLALLGFSGVPVEDRPFSHLVVTPEREEEIDLLLKARGVGEERIALIHPAAAFETKRWPVERYARVVDFIESRGLFPVVVTAPAEKRMIDDIRASTQASFQGFSDLSLPQIAAISYRSEIFIGNDSGIAHIAAAVNTPTVVIFGSSDREHWKPWTAAPSEIVYNEFHCQPCPGYECREFGEPRCILSVETDQVITAIERVLARANKSGGKISPAAYRIDH